MSQPEVETLYKRIGGSSAVKATVVKLYEKILEDELLIPFFVDVNVDQLRRSQSAFVMMAFGGPDTYSGESLRKAHAPMVEQGLDDVHFDAVANHLKAALEELEVPADLAAEALAIVGATRNDILNR